MTKVGWQIYYQQKVERETGIKIPNESEILIKIVEKALNFLRKIELPRSPNLASGYWKWENPIP